MVFIPAGEIWPMVHSLLTPDLDHWPKAPNAFPKDPRKLKMILELLDQQLTSK